MKLELKHLAPYLPYGLKVKHDFEKVRYNGRKSPLEDWIMTLEPSMLNCFILKDKRPFNRKPILRPLSDLSRYNDEVEINEHYINEFLTNPEYGQEYGVFSHYKGEIDIELDGDPQVRYDQRKTISFKCIHKITELLYKGHYDVFNLIPNGLAIDINTINS
jgi:hypothetical protein